MMKVKCDPIPSVHFKSSMHTNDKNDYKLQGRTRERNGMKIILIHSLLLLRRLLSGLGDLATLAIGLLNC